MRVNKGSMRVEEWIEEGSKKSMRVYEGVYERVIERLTLITHITFIRHSTPAPPSHSCADKHAHTHLTIARQRPPSSQGSMGGLKGVYDGTMRGSLRALSHTTRFYVGTPTPNCDLGSMGCACANGKYCDPSLVCSNRICQVPSQAPTSMRSRHVCNLRRCNLKHTRTQALLTLRLSHPQRWLHGLRFCSP
jgi:hypothetical protein